MQTPETRATNQCTYTPVTHDPGGDGTPGFVARQPFLKLAVLSTVFDDPALLKPLLSVPADGPLPPPQPELSEAVTRLWGGDTAGAAQLVGDVAMDQVVAFAQDALVRFQALLSTAEKDVDSAIAAVARRTGAGPEAVSRVAGEAAAVRSASVEQAREMLTPATAETLRSTGTVPAGVAAAPAQAGDGAAAAPAQAGDGQPVVAISHDAVQEELVKRSPATASFLSGVRFFTFAKPVTAAALGETASLVGFTAIQSYLAEQKQAAVKALSVLGKIEPVGFLHLERLQFTPVGYERGELVYSLPMLPGETVRLSHREWSKTETEYTQLVATSLETAKEDALSEKSELAESVTTQQQHTSAFNASTTASGGFGPVHVSATVGYSVQNSESSSRQSSAKRSQEITKKAASRSKEEHKVSFRVTTQYEVEEQSFREITNALDHPVRWDFYRLMKKWQIDLYRYDIRMTYDVVIPEPGSYLLRRHIELKLLENALARPFKLRGSRRHSFNGSPQDISRWNWAGLATEYGASLDPPPEASAYATAHAEQTYSQRDLGSDYVAVNLPDGYRFVRVWAMSENIQVNNKLAAYINVRDSFNQATLNAGLINGNTFLWRYDYDWAPTGTQALKGSVLSIEVNAHGVLTERAFEQWQMQCFQRLLDAARGTYEESQQRLQKRRDELKAELEREDVLTLRKLEKEELMKGVLRWVLGPGFTFYPPDLPPLTLNPQGDLGYYDPATEGVASAGGDDAYRALLNHGDLIRFLHHAIEWENVNYVLYPYFWTDTRRWDFKQSLFHSDYEHRAFLRAGAARVVLTIRPDYEKAFLSFMETGQLDRFLVEGEPGYPYMKIADEMKAMAMASYPYTPSANAENPNNLVDTWFEFTPTGALDVAQGTVLDPAHG